ncbi:MAG TPA: hypothetical protein VJT50_02070 [Pyrinomonadaceae bacterium]|nr:hypothetical protein [Pyrinomonadaceae bacterium]
MQRYFWIIVLFSLVAGSCNWRNEIGGHDFCWALDREKDPPWRYLQGWVKWNHQKPFCAICTLSDTGGARETPPDANGRRVITFSGFDGSSIPVPSFRKAIYALQPDKSLRKIPLSNEEVETALAILDDLDHQVYAPDHPLIATKILPQLVATE